MAPPPLPPDYSGGNPNLGWTVPAETVSPNTNQNSDDWGGWGATSAPAPAPAQTPVVKAENGGAADPWDYQADTASSKPAAYSTTNQVMGTRSLLFIFFSFLPCILAFVI